MLMLRLHGLPVCVLTLQRVLGDEILTSFVRNLGFRGKQSLRGCILMDVWLSQEQFSCCEACTVFVSPYIGHTVWPHAIGYCSSTEFPQKSMFLSVF